jgi:hypothetical protein
VSVCSAQIIFKVDKRKKDTTKTIPSSNEKKELPTLKQTQFLQQNNIISTTTDPQYVTDFQKATIKEVIGNSQKTDKELLNENMQGILSGVRKANEDKRSTLLKAVQSALSVAQAAVVTALAVREVVREIEKKK